ncbi:hypothetical protein BN946_scf184747.g58 [Trametes cinnabarina]|uniref:Uncharacterized protein n=1 Tax=Pycnoporus cinnabarinus TaxID=5643 RepID=A0A060SS92_PYCCI|nr:hypothetical protein BN946_scf184747.g58 [Trametes cinnabarina]
MVSDEGYVYVDDGDSKIVYSDNWEVSSISFAYDGTLHAALVKDATATLRFTAQDLRIYCVGGTCACSLRIHTGTSVSVAGGIGDVARYGWPGASFALDGKVLQTFNMITDTHQDDYSVFSYNYTYFDSPVLSPGKHTLVVTTLNGTSPNTFGLTTFVFAPWEVLRVLVRQPLRPRPHHVPAYALQHFRWFIKFHVRELVIIIH